MGPFRPPLPSHGFWSLLDGRKLRGALISLCNPDMCAFLPYFLITPVDIWERNKELIRKRTDIGEHFTREIIQSIVFIILPLGERVHLNNRSITTNLLGTKNVFRCE